jgi:flavodoxin/ferredoxin
MKTLIICFSQTGNTLKLAESILEGVKDATGSCDFVNMADVDQKVLADYDLIGLGCPVFYYQEPYNVREFMEGLPELERQHWFVFCSHGSVLGLTLLSITERLERKGATVIGSHHTYSDATVPFYPYPTVTTGHPDAQELQEARDFGKEIAQCSQAVARGDTGCITKPAPVTEDWVPEQAAMLTSEFMSQVMPRLSINTETCIECGDCQDACPVDGIDIEVDPPRIQEPCIFCWCCAKICPTCSIETDWSPLESMAPDQYARYIKALKDAEARGEFRWLMDPDTLNFNDPLYKQRERQIKAEKN